MNLAEAAEKIIPINPNIPGGTVAPGDPSAFVQSAYTFLFSVSGIIAFLALLYAAVLWASAGGNSSKVGEAKKKMNDVFLGLGILFGAYLLANFVDSSLTKIQLPKLEDAVVKMEEQVIKLDVPVGSVAGNSVTLGESQMRQDLKSKGIDVWESRPGATQVNGLRQGVINEVLAAKASCGCAVTITGGTEPDSHSGGTRSHPTGFKVDLDDTEGLNNWVIKSGQFTSAGTRRDGAALYKNKKTGAIWAKEGNHWDIVVP